VTGGCGFIGSNFINYIRDIHKDIIITNIDKLDYCSNPENVTNQKERYSFFKCDINNIEFVLHILKEKHIDTVIHFAAQSHVDNSFGNSLQFSQDNILGTHSLLESCKEYGQIRKFIHISTDEVYGEIDSKDCSHETSLLNPTNPYAASKAAAEFIVRSYYYSFKLPIIIIRGNNVFGPRQYPEKLIPKFITSLFRDEKCTIQGKGNSIRNFIYVDDFCRGVLKVLEKGIIMKVYNIGTKNEYNVLEVTKLLIEKLKPGKNWQDYIEYIPDRLFNDQRYSINSDCIRNELNWKEEISFKDGLEKTIDWYYQQQHKKKKIFDPCLLK